MQKTAKNIDNTITTHSESSHHEHLYFKKQLYIYKRCIFTLIKDLS